MANVGSHVENMLVRETKKRDRGKKNRTGRKGWEESRKRKRRKDRWKEETRGRKKSEPDRNKQ